MKFIASMMFLLWAACAHAADPQPVDADRLYQFNSQLRCMVCQNESLADSNAPLAVDLKNLVRERMAAGESNEQIKSFLVERYGDFVTYRPPFNASTLLLWLGPLLLLALGALVVWRNLRASPAGSAAADEEDEEDNEGTP
jgi:cytochrome c-type biogenesis protein CcmH